MSGAQKIGPQDHPRLYNVVEEMKIASGLEKMPDVYIIDDPALNAFSTGRDARIMPRSPSPPDCWTSSTGMNCRESSATKSATSKTGISG